FPFFSLATSTPAPSTLSLHDALPICGAPSGRAARFARHPRRRPRAQHQQPPHIAQDLLRLDPATLRRPVLPKRVSQDLPDGPRQDRKSTRLNSSHVESSYAVFCLKKK